MRTGYKQEKKNVYIGKTYTDKSEVYEGGWWKKVQV
jgi:hypothetical protein